MRTDLLGTVGSQKVGGVAFNWDYQTLQPDTNAPDPYPDLSEASWPDVVIAADAQGFCRSIAYGVRNVDLAAASD